MNWKKPVRRNLLFKLGLNSGGLSMGTIYSVLPLKTETREWLYSMGIESPEGNGRNPTVEEIKAAVESIGLATEWIANSKGWTGEISNSSEESTTLRVENKSVLELKGECEFYFSKGSEEIIHEVVEAVAAIVGPLVIYPDSGESIRVVS